jgi:hypothetical protein
VSVGWGPLAKATSRSITDYGVAHRLATAHPTTPEDLAELERFAADAVSNGSLVKIGGVAEILPDMKTALNGVHDAVVRRTR